MRRSIKKVFDETASAGFQRGEEEKLKGDHAEKIWALQVKGRGPGWLHPQAGVENVVTDAPLRLIFR